jgi:succinoglycan biosynthesis transport protein ExoP
LTFHQFLLALRARRKLFGFIMLVTVLLATVVSLLLPRTYVSRASVLVDKTGEVIGFTETQADIIKSSKVARKVIDELKLAHNDKNKEAFQSETGGAGTIEDWLTEGILKKLKVDWSQSSVIDIKYSSSDPKLAAAVANGFAKGYVQTIQDLAVEPTRESLGWFDEQLKGLRATLDAAQAKLAQHQKEKGIPATDERFDVDSSRLAELSTQLLAAQNQAQDAAIRQQQARSFVGSGASPENMPEIMGNPFIQALKTDILRGEAKLQELRSELGPNHPQLKAQISENQSLRERLESEMGKVVAGLGSTVRQARERENELRSALEAQRSRVMHTKQARNEGELLQREVESARQAYANAYERSMVNRVQTKQRQPQVAVLNNAVEPVLPSSPKILLNIALAVVVGLMLGVALVYLLEATDRRVRSRLEFEAYVPIPMLGELNAWRTERGGRLIEAPGSVRMLPRPA